MVYRKMEQDAAESEGGDTDREARLAAEEALLRGGAGDYPAERAGARPRAAPGAGSARARG
jgi:hypothetical protein